MNTYSCMLRLCGLGFSLLVLITTQAQQPFDVDTTYQTGIETWYVSSILPLDNGNVIASGEIRYDGGLTQKTLVRLLHSGQRDNSFYNSGLGGGFIRPWLNKFYVSTPHTVRRIQEDGYQDLSFIPMNLQPYFSSIQGGDYHVYPDGRILMSGVHGLHDSIRGFDGLYCLIWFSNTGYLDTTQTHRTCAGSLDFFTELPNGQFIGSGSTSVWDGQQASNIIRFNADGSLDPAFQANVNWGQALAFLPLSDGRVYVGGQFRIDGMADTLNLVRLLPDGSLDPTFNNTVRYRFTNPLYPNNPPKGFIRTIYALTPDQLIITGNYASVDGVPRGCIAVIDTSGNLLDDSFTGEGIGSYFYQANINSTPSFARVIGGIASAPDGSYYIWGAYHGYDDGTTNDTTQRMVSRLYGLDVGLSEHASTDELVSIYPNPGNDQLWIDGLKDKGVVSLKLFDARGVLVLDELLTNSYVDMLSVRSGFYTVFLQARHGRTWHLKWVKE